MSRQHLRHQSVQPQHARLLLIPPAATKQHRRALIRTAGSVFQFQAMTGQQGFQRLAGLEKIMRKIFAQVLFADERPTGKIPAARSAVKRHRAPLRQQRGYARQLRGCRQKFRRGDHRLLSMHHFGKYSSLMLVHRNASNRRKNSAGSSACTQWPAAAMVSICASGNNSRMRNSSAART